MVTFILEPWAEPYWEVHTLLWGLWWLTLGPSPVSPAQPITPLATWCHLMFKPSNSGRENQKAHTSSSMGQVAHTRLLVMLDVAAWFCCLMLPWCLKKAQVWFKLSVAETSVQKCTTFSWFQLSSIVPSLQTSVLKKNYKPQPTQHDPLATLELWPGGCWCSGCAGSTSNTAVQPVLWAMFCPSLEDNLLTSTGYSTACCWHI